MRMPADLPSRIAAHRWFHTMDLGGGLRTVGIHNPLTRLPLLGLPESLAGLSVLDVGAWDGFFAFECERRGATRVVASDHFSWHGPGWGTKAGFEMAREALGSQVEDIDDIDVMNLSPEQIGTFDLLAIPRRALSPARSAGGDLNAWRPSRAVPPSSKPWSIASTSADRSQRSIQGVN